MPSRAKVADALGRRIGIGLVQELEDLAGEVDQVEIDAAPADLQPEAQRALGVQRVRHQRLADLAAQRLAAQQQAIGLERIGDDRDGLRRQPGHAGDIGLGQVAVAADQRQHQALVVEAHAGLVGAARGSRRPRSRGSRVPPVVTVDDLLTPGSVDNFRPRLRHGPNSHDAGENAIDFRGFASPPERKNYRRGALCQLINQLD